MNPSTIICPKCQTAISLDEVITHELEVSVEKKYEAKREKEREEERNKMRLWQEKREKELVQKNEQDAKMLREDSERKDKLISQFRENELALRKRTQELEEKEKNLELEKQRQIDEERKKIQQKTAEEVTEKFHLKEKEKDSIIDSLKKSLEEAQRKASQGSQQLQGEVLELELEEILKREFPLDDITEVGKGKTGADILQVVKDKSSRECGKIVWETKRTRNFEEGWIEKLKGDQREAKADMAILVSTVLPKDIRVFGQRKGVHVTGFECLLQVAQLLRSQLIVLSNMKSLSVGKNERIESLYRYITSAEFAQRIDSIIQNFQKQRELLEKDKMNDQKSWAVREKLIEQQQYNTMNVYGSLSGLSDAPLPQIASLEISAVVTDNFSLLPMDELSEDT